MVGALRTAHSAFVQPNSLIRTVCLGAIVVAGLVSNLNSGADSWVSAGRTFQGGALVAGILACIWSVGLIMHDAETGMIETIVATGYSAGRYTIRKLIGVLIPLLASGVALLVFSCLARLLLFGHFDFIPLLCALASVYLPICLFSICLSACISTITGMKTAAILFFGALWMAGMLWLPPIARIFDVTGQALDQAYFEAPLESSTVQGIPEAVFEQAAAIQGEQMAYAHYNICFLAAGAALFLVILIARMNRWWKFDAAPLLPGARTSRPLFVPMLDTVPGLKLLGWSRIMTAVVLMFALDALALAVPDSSSAIPKVTESLLPLLFAILYASIPATETKQETHELTLCLPGIGRIHAQRILCLTLVLCALLCLQAGVFQGMVSSGFAGIFLMGFAPTICLGGLAYLCSIKMKFESTALLATLGAWAFLHIPLVAAFANAAVPWLYPFPSSFEIEASFSARILSIILGIAFLYAGYHSIKNKHLQKD